MWSPKRSRSQARTWDRVVDRELQALWDREQGEVQAPAKEISNSLRKIQMIRPVYVVILVAVRRAVRNNGPVKSLGAHPICQSEKASIPCKKEPCADLQRTVLPGVKGKVGLVNVLSAGCRSAMEVLAPEK